MLFLKNKNQNIYNSYLKYKLLSIMIIFGRLVAAFLFRSSKIPKTEMERVIHFYVGGQSKNSNSWLQLSQLTSHGNISCQLFTAEIAVVTIKQHIKHLINPINQGSLSITPKNKYIFCYSCINHIKNLKPLRKIYTKNLKQMYFPANPINSHFTPGRTLLSKNMNDIFFEYWQHNNTIFEDIGIMIKMSSESIHDLWIKGEERILQQKIFDMLKKRFINIKIYRRQIKTQDPEQ